MITLILLPIFLLFTYLFYTNTQKNIDENKPMLEDSGLYLIIAVTIFLISITFCIL